MRELMFATAGYLLLAVGIFTGSDLVTAMALGLFGMVFFCK